MKTTCLSNEYITVHFCNLLKINTVPCRYISFSTQSNFQPRHVFAIFLNKEIYCQTLFFTNIPKVKKNIEAASLPCNNRSGFWAMRNSWVISAVNCQLKFKFSIAFKVYILYSEYSKRKMGNLYNFLNEIWLMRNWYEPNIDILLCLLS